MRHHRAALALPVPASRVAGLALAIVLLTAAFATFLAPAPANAAVGYSISGTVTQYGSGAAVPDCNVYVWRYSVSAAKWYEYQTTLTGPSGTYSFTGLPKGFYRVEFWREGYLGEFYNDKIDPSSANYVLVSATPATANASLYPRSPSLSGTVTGPEGEPAEGVLVTAYWPHLGAYIEMDWTLTEADGTYLLHDLGTGTYAIEFYAFAPTSPGADTPYYVTEYYNNKTTLGTATLVPTTSGSVKTGIDAVLARRTPTISGRVRDSGSSASLEGITVTVRNSSTGATVASGKTADGYAFWGLADGTYRLQFTDANASDGAYPAGFWEDAASWAAADDVVVSSSTQDIELGDQHMTAGGAAIEGTVTCVRDDEPLAGISATAYIYDELTKQWVAMRTAKSSADGAYSLEGLAPGDYRVRFSDPEGLFATEYYDDPGTGTTPDVVTWDGGTTVTGIGAALDYAPADAARVSARTRFSTAIAIARAGFPDYADIDTVVIASGDDRAAADPLAASGLCWLYDAPLLLVSASSTPDDVKVALRDIVAVNGPVNVRVVGGPVSIPKARMTELKSYVEGYFGRAGLVNWGRVTDTGGRYFLARKIAEEMKSRAAAHGKTLPDFALIANGADPTKFFDALALSPIAARNGSPILLVEAKVVPSDTGAALAALGVSKCVIGGGPNTVTSTVKSRLARYYTVEQWYGRSRYDTAVAIADRSIEEDYLTDAAVGIAAKLPDALAGGAMVGRRDGVLLLTRTDVLETATARWLGAHRREVRECHVFGGVNSVKQAVLNAVDAILGGA